MKKEKEEEEERQPINLRHSYEMSFGIFVVPPLGVYRYSEFDEFSHYTRRRQHQQQPEEVHHKRRTLPCLCAITAHQSVCAVVVVAAASQIVLHEMDNFFRIKLGFFKLKNTFFRPDIDRPRVGTFIEILRQPSVELDWNIFNYNISFLIKNSPSPLKKFHCFHTSGFIKSQLFERIFLINPVVCAV